MQVLLLGLFVAIYLHDATTGVELVSGGEVIGFAEATPDDRWPMLGLVPVLLIVLIPKFAVAMLYAATCRITRHKLGTRSGQRWLNRLEAMTVALPLLLLGLFLIDMGSGALRHLRVAFTQTVLIDEVLVMLPTLAVATFAWAAYYPVDRRLREALILRDADAGRPLYPLLSRGGYVLMQLRHQFGLLLLPLLAVFAWSELLVILGPDHGGPLNRAAVTVLSPLGVLAVFIGAPLVIRYVWQTVPLPRGEVRDRMTLLCEQHNVRVRELLLWQTSGRTVNAAVTGLVGRVRFILLSDALLDQLDPRSVEAVMAHELAHVKCKHLVWMALVVLAAIGTSELIITRVYDGLLEALAWEPLAMQRDVFVANVNMSHPDIRMLVITLPAFAIALVIFGWVSRRIERQADVFAVRHLAMNADEKHMDVKGRHCFDEASIATMVHALQRVAVLNHAPTARKSWRHGSIAWRQNHLRSLEGTPIDAAGIDRQLAKVKVATLLGVTITAAFYLT
jgi:Zn-dependent protease with chaperone function